MTDAPKLVSPDGATSCRCSSTEPNRSNTPKEAITYENGAELHTLKVWKCAKCGRNYPEDQEESARRCCRKGSPCIVDGCANRTFDAFDGKCGSCRAKERAQRQADAYEEAPRVEWDGATPLKVFWEDQFFFGSTKDILECVVDYAHENGLDPMKVQLETCREWKIPTFDVRDFLADFMEDGYMSNATEPEINAKVNTLLESYADLNQWVGTGKVPTQNSLILRSIGVPADGE